MPSRPSPDTAPLQALQGLRDGYRQDKAALLDKLQAAGASTRGIRKLLLKLSHLTDRLLCRLWAGARLPQDWALLAVGGYGRAQLFAHSDVDVLLLLPDGTAAALDDARKPIAAFISSCWDAGLEIGSSVRSVAECLSDTGDAHLEAPRYDIAHFADELPAPLDSLSHGALRALPIEASTGPAFNPSSRWVWAAIILLMLGMAWMAVRMLRKS